MHINDLPREISEAIFDMHVYVFRGSRHPLQLVCRHWYSIAITYRALWQSIAFGHQISVVPATILCPDLESLALVLKRTGTATFDFYLGAPFFELVEEDIQSFMSVVEKNWLSRCRYLMVFPNTGDALGSIMLRTIFLSCDFGALECLEIRHEEGHETWELLLRIIVERIDSSAHRIRTLKIRVDGVEDYNTSWITRCLFASTNILGGISSLQLRGTYEPVPWDNLHNLEELELWTHSQIWPAITFDFPRVPHLTLGNTDTLNTLSSSNLWGFLTRLILKDLQDDLSNTIHLPSLEFLGLIHCDGLDLQLIDAPKLRELEIRFHPFDGISYVYPVLENATIKPQVLRIDVQNVAPNSHLLPLVASSAVWLQVEEFQLRMRGDYTVLPSMLSDMFSGVSSPKLHSLTVLCPLLDEISHGRAVRHFEEMQRKEIMRIVEAWIPRGAKQIDRLELGWYSEHGDDYVHKEWRVVEWIDCLRND